MHKLIKTIKDRCHECYACVRNCPVKAVRVREGQAEVIEERCINCANCVNICSQGAKEVQNNINLVREMLNNGERVVAGLAPSFPAYNNDLNINDWENILQGLGFENVYEVSWGAQLIIEEYKKLLRETKDLVISTACPVIVNYVEKYYPQLIPNLAPVVSPMGALARYINKVEEGDVKLVLIGPCHAKKKEFEYDKNVSSVLTFSELSELADDFAVNFQPEEKIYENIEEPNVNPSEEARKVPLAGGMLEAVKDNNDTDDFIKVEGQKKLSEIFELIIKDVIKPRFVDALFCEGCISGVDMLEKSFFKKEKLVNKFIKIGNQKSLNANYNRELIGQIDLDTSYKEDYQKLPQPSEEEIWDILNKTNKFDEDDLLNCGACGYNSCEEIAIAVYQGLAEVEMCLPYLLSEKRSEIKQIQELNKELDSIVNSSYDGIVVVDNKGYIERVNQSYIDMIGVPREELVGKNVSDLEKERIFYPSVSLLSLREKRNITLVQNTSNGKRILVTAKPIISNSDKVRRVMINARDINELDVAVNNSEERDKLKIYLEQEDNMDQSGVGHIITSSRQMKNIIKLAKKIGNTDSTVLITGDSGVGKEVVARYIHEQSEDREEFVKINCAAIPERLLESELFGYETGAFSGARREGKSGLIEKADNGTLFLDEIGEMPANMQAKLLQVIQEHRVTRIGGVEAIDVNFRLITATNRDLKNMVNNNQFREDLYYRLNVVPIQIPPLKNRKEDIFPLVEYFSNQFNDKYNKNVEFSSDAKELIYEYDWPGNVRELINLLERVIVTTEGDIVDDKNLKRFIDTDADDEKPEIMVNDILPIKEAVARVEKELLMMAQEEGKTTYEMANILGVNQSTVVRKIKKYFK